MAENSIIVSANHYVAHLLTTPLLLLLFSIHFIIGVIEVTPACQKSEKQIQKWQLTASRIYFPINRKTRFIWFEVIFFTSNYIYSPRLSNESYSSQGTWFIEENIYQIRVFWKGCQILIIYSYFRWFSYQLAIFRSSIYVQKNKSLIELK